MPHNQNYRLWRAVAQCLSGSIAVALLTFVCFRLQLNLATTACLYLVIIVLLALRGSFLSSGAVSLIAVGCLNYYFVPPIFSFRVSDPFNSLAIITFLITSAGTTHLVTRVRRLTQEKLQQSATYLSEAQRARSTTTDATGSHEFFLLPPGNYRVCFAAVCYRVAEVPLVTVKVTENSSTQLNS